MRKKPSKFGLVKPTNNVFGDTDVEDAPPPPPQESRMDRRATEQVESALAADPTIFAYDEVYDAMKAEKQTKKDPSMRPKYTETLLKQAEERKMEHELRKDRLAAKELDALDALGVERFVTSAYKEKLEEQQLWKAQLDARDEAVEKGVVSSAGKSGLLANLLNDQLVTQQQHIVHQDDGSQLLVRKRALQDHVTHERNHTHISTQAWDEKVLKAPTLAEKQRQKVAVPTRHTKESIQAARERYLQRRAQ